jgi:hypothetical protein
LYDASIQVLQRRSTLHDPAYFHDCRFARALFAVVTSSAFTLYPKKEVLRHCVNEQWVEEMHATCDMPL